MPLRDLFQRAHALLTGRLPEGDIVHDPVPSEVRRDAVEALLIETCRRLAVADHRLALIESSNRTAARALRRLLREREQLIAARETAEIRLSLAVSDQQRTMMLNDRLLSDLRLSEDARDRLGAENRHLRRQASGRSLANPAPAIGPGPSASEGQA